MTTRTETSILEHMSALAEPVRCRLLLLLDKNELTVSDLCSVVQLPQSTVSRHLKTLLERGWVSSRPDGTRRLYHSTVDGLSPSAQRLWDLTRAEVEEGSAGKTDSERLASVLSRQRSRSREFFDASGERWDALRDEMFGEHFHLQALTALIPPEWTVADLGCGTGALTEAIAPFAGHVIGVDTSAAMLELADRRLERFDNVELRHGELESLPLDDNQLDAVTLMLVLHHLEQPASAIHEAARCLRPGGRIVTVDMLPHDREEYRSDMGHVWMGFSEVAINEYLDDAGFEDTRFSVMPPSPEAKGPNLFVASANKRS